MSWCCMMSCFVDEHGPVSVSIWGYDLLWLCWWNSAGLQPRWPSLCLHTATAAPPQLWRLSHHYGQVRKSSEVTQPFPGSDPPQDQVLSIYSASRPGLVIWQCGHFSGGPKLLGWCNCDFCICIYILLLHWPKSKESSSVVHFLYCLCDFPIKSLALNLPLSIPPSPSELFLNLWKCILISIPSATCFPPRWTPDTQMPLPLPMTPSVAGSAVYIMTTVFMCGMWGMSRGWGRCTLFSSMLPVSGT